MSIVTCGYGAAVRVPALVVTQGYAPTLSWRGCYQSAHGSGGGAYQSSGGLGMGATPVGRTPHTVTLRTHERNVPFSLSFASAVASGDVISSAVVTVTARPSAARLSAATDVTNTMLMGQSITGTTVAVAIGNANAVRGTHYLIRVVATMASGVVLQETIGDGQASIVLCDE